jgi:Arm DNA-binding domain
LVRRQRPAASAYLIWDSKQHGLALRIQPTGARAYKCIYSYHGRPRWLHLGDAGAIGLAAARQLAAEAMLQVAKGIDPAAERRAMRSKGTFAELAPTLRCRACLQAQQVMAAGGGIGPAPLPAQMGQAATDHHHARRR